MDFVSSLETSVVEFGNSVLEVAFAVEFGNSVLEVAFVVGFQVWLVGFELMHPLVSLETNFFCGEVAVSVTLSEFLEKKKNNYKVNTG